eukprot:NODE_6059_length_577_cov_28.988889_g5894_i0.p4 GENE.NODE_6059_length_577_cov_28.988889_g5894_i0~~NODE_6059_length_577_cov_28.988889_g5894_i0.p4  ORF type:complete len:140 (+),score=56.56 NODE_6059_length_577_cov_28.988889_g5894_i0:36-422(+)
MAENLYLCQKCRTCLFCSSDRKPHDQWDSQPKNFQRKHRDAVCGAQECTSYFLQEDAFFGDTTAMEGRVHCPRCNLVLGAYNWAGCQCSCGRWVCPAFRVVHRKVDEWVPPSPIAVHSDVVDTNTAIA